MVVYSQHLLEKDQNWHVLVKIGQRLQFGVTHTNTAPDNSDDRYFMKCPNTTNTTNYLTINVFIKKPYPQIHTQSIRKYGIDTIFLLMFNCCNCIIVVSA